MLSQEAAGIRPTSKKNRHLVLTESLCPESVPYQYNPAHHPSFSKRNLSAERRLVPLYPGLMVTPLTVGSIPYFLDYNFKNYFLPNSYLTKRVNAKLPLVVQWDLSSSSLVAQ